MTDNLSREARRRAMQAVRPTHTALEDSVIKELWRRGIRFRRNVKDLIGKPDIAIKRYKVVIFIDSCFWHGCELHCRIPKTNEEYWIKKIIRNKQRYKEIVDYYKLNNWHILRIWEHQIQVDFSGVIDRIAEFIGNAK